MKSHFHLVFTQWIRKVLKKKQLDRIRCYYLSITMEIRILQNNLPLETRSEWQILLQSVTSLSIADRAQADRSRQSVRVE
jgi:hypothetical protein